MKFLRVIVVLVVWFCCFSTGCEVVEEPADHEIVVPNFFSPNADGMNDFFEVTAKDGSEVSLSIYTRSGVLVFTIQAVRCQWDGYSLSGEVMPTDVYLYFAETIGRTPENVSRSGFFHLYR